MGVLFLSERSRAGKTERRDHWGEKRKTTVNGEKSLLPQSLQKIMEAKLLFNRLNYNYIDNVLPPMKKERKSSNMSSIPRFGSTSEKKTVVFITEQINK